MTFKGIHPKFVNLTGVLLTVLFVYTAISKLIHLDTFQLRLERMPFINSYAQIISWGVPFVELVIAGLLWFGKYRIKALFASLLLLGLFTAYIAIVLKFSDSVPCSCGGIISAMGWRDHILFNSTFMLLALLGILGSKQQTKIPSHENTT